MLCDFLQNEMVEVAILKETGISFSVAFLIHFYTIYKYIDDRQIRKINDR